MVGGAAGAAMTAVTMIFEMTRDYDLVMPSIISVALAIGVRRLLSQENIYTIKLVGRGHLVPKALHANMFLVRRAGEVMERDVILLPTEENFGAFLRQQAGPPPDFGTLWLRAGTTSSASFASISDCGAASKRPMRACAWAI